MIVGLRLVRALLPALYVLATASAASGPRAAELQDAHEATDATEPALASSTDAVEVETWEVQVDGSVFSNEQQQEELQFGRPLDRKKESVLIDEVGHWEPAVGGDEDDDEGEEEEEEAVATEQTASLVLLKASEAFVALINRMEVEGFTAEIVEELEKVVDDRLTNKDPERADDWAFAVTTLSLQQLFEPDAASSNEQTFIDAVNNLYVAADAGVQSALSVRAMLDLIGIPDPGEMEDSTIVRLSRQQKQIRGDRMLSKLLAVHDFTATLAVAYGTLSGRISAPRKSSATDASTDADSVCEAAVPLYHTCAEQNVHIIDSEGGEQIVGVARLSDELLYPPGGSFIDDYDIERLNPLHDENAAVHELELYHDIANNPMDERYPQAMLHLADTYFFGNMAAHVAADRELGARYFRLAADAGNPVAQGNYGMLLARGVGVDRDVQQAIVYFDRAARQKEAFALHGLGVIYFTGDGIPQNVTRALELFEEAIALGYIESHLFLGSAYLQGDGDLPVDEKMAFSHVEAAVDDTDGQSSRALFELGVMHFRGIGTPRSCRTALSLFRPVALHPNVLSALPFSLTKAYECYTRGDYLRAYLHYRLVAELGDEDGQCNAAFLLEHYGDRILKWQWLGLAKSTEDSSSPLLREVLTLYSQASALNDSEAIRKTGVCFHEPWAGVCSSNHTRALERYRFAAELGNVQAGYDCGSMLATGDGVPRDLAAARSCYIKCSEASFPANVPCVLALAGLNILLFIEGIVQKIWVW
ncbi:unnamed protein product [Hyaloperonospora brassicae]|uniref:RxLR effector protein n=1 Tax=Hyaloperonospora brassicae TaxID=162125 RepID=A0AAV0TEQ3_HYABA|nr:unnamed protein product [Hyaloperonospora brassicae]